MNWLITMIKPTKENVRKASAIANFLNRIVYMPYLFFDTGGTANALNWKKNKGELIMNLLEYMKQHKEEEITVFDKDYDMETYFEYSTDSKDNWEKAMDKIAEHLEVVE